ncbi:MAG: TAT-variant-translocated molybdopterin oxidoreductase [Roseibacillus sp.]
MSKRIWQHPEIPSEETGIVSWRSVGELEKSAGFQQHLEREFPEGADTLSEEEREGSRRSFLKLMGASSALSGLALVSCRRPESYIVPYKKAPEWIIPGKPLYYASTRPRAEGAVPLVVTTYEGRPTKLETNREHPDGGGSDALTQASVLNIYDPKRSRDFLRKGEKSSREDFGKALAAIAKAPGKTAFLFGEDDCPTRNRLKGELARAFPEAKFYSYEALRGLDKRKVQDEVFGAGSEVTVDFKKADRILSLDCDFLGIDPQGSSGAFSRRRQGGGADYKHDIAADQMNRLYMVETAYSLTGGMADHRLRAIPSMVLRVAVEIARKLEMEIVGALDKDISGTLKDELLEAMAQLNAITKNFGIIDGGEFFGGESKKFVQWAQACAEDLFKHAGRSVVLAGSRQNEALQRLAIAMNKALKAYGADGPLSAVQTDRDGYGTIGQLVEDLDSNTTVFLLGPSNPIYDTPGDLKFKGALGRAKVSIHLGLRTDATALACSWHVPAAHYLECWSDARSATGVYSLVQPMILPLYDGVSELEILSQLLAWSELDWAKVESGEVEAPVLVSGEGADGAASPAYYEVQATFARIGEEGDDAWKDALKNGFLADSSYDSAEVGDPGSANEPESSPAGLEVNFIADASVWDGRYIDNGWLQEAPDPISKLSWDNAALVSPRTAKELGVYEVAQALVPKSKVPVLGEVANAPKPVINEGKNAKAQMTEITIGSRTLQIPVLVAFGHADNCVSLPLGYGQGASDGREGVDESQEDDPYAVVGLVGINTGFNGNLLRSKENGGFAVAGAAIKKIKGKYPVALVQEHNAMNGRALAREVSTNEVAHKPFEKQIANVRRQGPVDSHAPENISLYKRQGSSWENDEAKQVDLISDKIHQWGMSIDLNTCIGCNACMVACQAENNIPIVGKEQVAMGREMHWIRMDRYFATPTYERDDHGHIVKEGHKKKEVPRWVQENPELVPQPVACQQCENAPCETVCPVNATVHTEEGLNAMAYNRCIGTRYCANNCPYKARRFNFFDYNQRNPLIAHNLYKGPFGEKKVGEAPHLQRNPNVSVRMRGVMEKCTYCVQRLESAKIKQKQIGRQKTLEAGANSTAVAVSADDLRIKVDSVRTACQDACPTEAISFGNLLDKKESKVWRAKYKGEKKNGDGLVTGMVHNPRSYDSLQYIGTAPRTSYLARVKNPNKDMPDAKYRGLATIHTG